MSKIRNEYYPTLTDKERKLLFCKLRQRYKSDHMLRRLLHKEARPLGRIMVRKRIASYRRSLDPRGEPFYKRPSPWKCVIKTADIAYLLGICERYAQEKHKMLKDELGKQYVTVKEFCKSTKLDEEYVQALLNDGEAREINSGKFRKMIDEINRRHAEEIRQVKESARKEREEEEKSKKEEDAKKIKASIGKPVAKDDKNKKGTKPKKAS